MQELKCDNALWIIATEWKQLVKLTLQCSTSMQVLALSKLGFSLSIADCFISSLDAYTDAGGKVIVSRA